MTMPLRGRYIGSDWFTSPRLDVCECQSVSSPISHVARRECMVCAAHYRSDLVSVALALIEHERKLVLIQRTKAPLEGYWAPPAGHVEFGESITHAAIREAREESGLNISLDALDGVYRQNNAEPGRVNMMISAYRGRSIDGVPMAGDDAGDLQLFHKGEIPYQPPPEGGSATDYWVYGVIQELLAPWRRVSSPSLKLLKTTREITK